MIETAKSNDPATLKEKIRELEYNLKCKMEEIKILDARKPEAPARPPIDFFPFKKISTELSIQIEPLEEMLSQLVTAIKTAETMQSVKLPAGVTVTPQFVNAYKSVIEKRKPATSTDPESDLGKCEREVLGVLFALTNDHSLCKERVAVLSGYSVNSGGFKNALSRLRSLGYVDGLKPTPTAPVIHRAIKTQEEVVQDWMPHLPKCERALLEALFSYGPLDKETLAAKTEYQVTSGGFKNAISHLRTLELINRGDATIYFSKHVTG